MRQVSQLASYERAELMGACGLPDPVYPVFFI